MLTMSHIDVPSTQRKIREWHARGATVELLARQFECSTAMILIILGGDRLICNFGSADEEEEVRSQESGVSEADSRPLIPDPSRRLRGEPLRMAEVLKILPREGTMYLSQICERVQRPAPKVCDALQRLIKAGQVRRVSTGCYQAV